MVIDRVWLDKTFVLGVAIQVTKFMSALPEICTQPPGLSAKEWFSLWMWKKLLNLNI